MIRPRIGGAAYVSPRGVTRRRSCPRCRRRVGGSRWKFDAPDRIRRNRLSWPVESLQAITTPNVIEVVQNCLDLTRGKPCAICILTVGSWSFFATVAGKGLTTRTPGSRAGRTTMPLFRPLNPVTRKQRSRSFFVKCAGVSTVNSAYFFEKELRYVQGF